MSRDRYHFIENGQPHFITMTVVRWLPLFGSKAVAQAVLDSLTFLQTENRLTLYAYVIMEHHVHLVASAETLSKEISNLKSFTARKSIDFFTESGAWLVLEQLEQEKLVHKRDRTYQFWQEGSHPKLIQGEAMMRQKIEYIHNNPVKRGYVDLPIHWRYSSARNYAGVEGLIPVQTQW